MDFKIFFTTFAVVFLAELGDKTQLTALALTSGNRGAGLSVFLGSAIALTCTSAVAVFCGDLIARYIPQKFLILGSAALFIVMGVVMLVSELMKK